MNIAVVDDGGHLVAFARMDGSIKASIDISIRKARTSILMNAPTSALTPLVQPGAELYGLEQTSGGMVIFGGGIPLTVDDVVIGAVGVSAGSVDQDVSVARIVGSPGRSLPKNVKQVLEKYSHAGVWSVGRGDARRSWAGRHPARGPEAAARLPSQIEP